MANDFNIYIESNDLSAKIELLKKEKENLINVLQNLKTDFTGLINYWNGNTGEKVYNYLLKYSSDFPKIVNEINKEIVFLECVIQAYNDMDDAISKRMEENSKIEM